MVMIPITQTALPVAMRLAGIGISRGAAAAGVAPMFSGGMGIAGMAKGFLITGVLGALGLTLIDELVDQLASMFGGDEETTKVLAIISAIEDAMGTGAILVPEPPRGYEGTVYQQRLNYFHANMNDGKLWLSDFSNGRNTWRGR